MEQSWILSLENISNLPDLYKFLRSQQKFYLIPFLSFPVIIDSKNIKITSLKGDNVKLDNYKIIFELKTLPEKQYIGFLHKAQFSEIIKNSIYKKYSFQNSEFTKITLFDIIDKLPYTARLEKLKLLVPNTLETITIPEIFEFYVKRTNSNEDIWARLLQFTRKNQNYILRQQDHNLYVDNDLMIYKDFVFKQCKVIQKKETHDSRYILCKLHNDYLKVVSGIDEITFSNLNIGDIITILVRSYQGTYTCPIFVSKNIS